MSCRTQSVPQTFCLFQRDRTVFVDVKPHQVFALSLGNLIALQFAIAVSVETFEDRFEVEARASPASDSAPTV